MRSGLKARALGADFCFAGRIPIWGLAVRFILSTLFDTQSLLREEQYALTLSLQWNGTEGVKLSIKLLCREFQKTMGLAG